MQRDTQAATIDCVTVFVPLVIFVFFVRSVVIMNAA
jgi:hypothetical protein